MKSIVSTAVLALFLGFSTLVAQTTNAPEEGAVQIGSFNLDLDVLSAPQPDMEYSVADVGTDVVETTLWLVSDGGVEVAVNANPVSGWAQNDPVYHNANQEYTLEKVGANAVWMARELGYNVGQETKAHMQETTATTIKNYEVDENGSNVEVYLIEDDGSS